LVDDLKKAIRGIDDLKRERSKLEGKREQLLSSLKETFGVSNVEEGKALLESLISEISGKELELKLVVQKLEVILEEGRKCLTQLDIQKS